MCRTCYDHLAGYVAVSLADALVGQNHLKIEAENYHLTASGTDVLERFGIDTAVLNKKKRTLARPCPDWTERRPHVGGALGSVLLQELLSRKWVMRLEQTRAVHLTPNGLAGLHDMFGVRL